MKVTYLRLPPAPPLEAKPTYQGGKKKKKKKHKIGTLG